MKSRLPIALTLFATVTARAAELPAQESWHAKSLPEALAHTAIFAVFGILTAIVGYKLFDLATPGRLHGEIIENRNVAAAIIGGAVIIGVSLIVAASMLG